MQGHIRWYQASSTPGNTQSKEPVISGESSVEQSSLKRWTSVEATATPQSRSVSDNLDVPGNGYCLNQCQTIWMCQVTVIISVSARQFGCARQRL